MTTEKKYGAYLIRWQDNGDPSRWRAEVENAYTGEKTLFTSKSSLVRFLWDSLITPLPPDQASRKSESL